MGIHNEELIASLSIWRLPGVGPKIFHKMKQNIGNLADVFSFERSKLLKAGLKEEAASILSELKYEYLLEDKTQDKHNRAVTELIGGVKKDLSWLEQANNNILLFDDPFYPEYLKAIHLPPPLLFVKGRAELLNNLQIGIVGSRNASRVGQANTFAFAKFLADQGVTITSGLALGIDGVAHQAAVGSKGNTIAVVANGLDQVYPKRHASLAENIVAGGGALVSEFPIGVLPRPQHFPRRNRIISGLSRGVLVVEAALKSGSLITARYAMEQGREVFAIPGSIHNPLAKGCHSLIKQGAALVETGEDILQELELRGIDTNFQGSIPEVAVESDEIEETKLAESGNREEDLKPTESEVFKAASEGELQTVETRIMDALGFEELSLDALVEITGIDASVLASSLIMLELQGKVIQEAGGYILAGAESDVSEI